MNVAVRCVEEDCFGEWNKRIQASQDGTPFHLAQWLARMAAVSRMRLFPLICTIESEVVAQFPVFLREVAGIRMIYSPSPQCVVPYLGPVFPGADGERADGRRKRAAVLEEVLTRFKDWRVDIIRLNFSPGIEEIRPLLKFGFSVWPCYEFRIQLNGSEEKLIGSFESETRTKIRRAAKYPGLRVERTTDQAAARQIHRLTAARYRDQGRSWNVSEDYIEDVANASPRGVVSTFTVKLHGETITGMVVCEYGNTLYDWIGGARPNEPLCGVNELLRWEIARYGRSKGLQWYNIGGANTPHISKAKSKYNPEVRAYYLAERKSARGRLAMAVLRSAGIGNYIKRRMVAWR